jgi:hypothetical protein
MSVDKQEFSEEIIMPLSTYADLRFFVFSFELSIYVED